MKKKVEVPIIGADLSLISLMGVIALSGVVVNDSLIMVDYANPNGPTIHPSRPSIRPGCAASGPSS